MTYSGIPVEKLTERLDKNIVRKWPFTDLIDARKYAMAFAPHSGGILKGKVMFMDGAERIAFNVRPAGRELADRVTLAMSASDALRWRWLAGVSLALEVGPTKESGRYGLVCRPERILAVQPPITHRRHRQASSLLDQGESGFLQGVVVGGEHGYDLRHGPRTVAFETPEMRSPRIEIRGTCLDTESRRQTLLTAGSIVRFTLDNPLQQTPSGAYWTNGTTWLLGQA